MPESNVQLTVEIETKGAEKLTTLRRDLEGVGKSGKEAFAGLDRSLRDAFEQQRRFARSVEPLFQNFFRGILSGATNFRDAFKRLFSDLLGFFTRTISRMVAAWLGGFGRMAGGSSANLLSGILSAPLGLGAGSTFLGSGGTNSASATAAAGISGGQFAAGAASFGGLLLTQFGIQRGSPGIGALGGALAGAGIGFQIGGPLGAGIGALVGGGIGLLGGLFGAARNRRRALRAERAFGAQLNSIFTEFEMRRLDFDAATASASNAFTAFEQTVGRFGRPGRRALGRGQDSLEALLERLGLLSGIRGSRAAFLAGGPAPEFQFGGFNPFNSFARLHAGEFVFRPEAVRAFGRENLERANRNPQSAAAPTVQLIFQPGSVVMQNGDPDEFVRRIGPKLQRFLDRELRREGRRL